MASILKFLAILELLLIIGFKLAPDGMLKGFCLIAGYANIALILAILGSYILNHGLKGLYDYLTDK